MVVSQFLSPLSLKDDLSVSCLWCVFVVITDWCVCEFVVVVVVVLHVTRPLLLPQLRRLPTSPQSPRQRKRRPTWLGSLAATAASPSSRFGWSTRRWRRPEKTGWRPWKTSPRRVSPWRSRTWRKVGHLYSVIVTHSILLWRWKLEASSRMS